MRDRLAQVRDGILARTGIEDAPRMSGFRAHGWHATKDGHEFAEPLLVELDRAAAFKGHVRYVISSHELTSDEKDRVFNSLFVGVLRVSFSRYRSSELTDIVFEDDQSPRSRYDVIVQRAQPSGEVRVSVEPKGDSALAMADYLLYATLKYVARVLEQCKTDNCGISHRPPISTEVSYDATGAIEMPGHLTASDFAFRMYKTFVRSMSSVLEVPGAIAG
ncbi:hypothetical protein [Microbacterium aurum]